MKLLFVGAHPADLVDLAGGTIANHLRKEDEVFTCAVTLGIYSHPVESNNELVKIDECVFALDLLGVLTSNRTFLKHPDGYALRESHICYFIEKVGELIVNVKPDIVVTHHPNEYNHPDHAKVGNWTLETIVAAGRKLPGTDKTHSVKNIYFYGYQFRPQMSKLGYSPIPPDVIVDISDVIELKAKAFMGLESQFNSEKIVWERLNSFEKEIGRTSGFDYAESFISLYPCKTTFLPNWNKTDFYSHLKKKAKQPRPFGI